MPEQNNRKKGTHLTYMDRCEIQHGLRQHRNFTEIARLIGCSPDTISKEIRRHRYHKPYPSKGAVPNRCKYRDSCRRKNVCQKKPGRKCKIPCRECTSCNKLCPDFVDAPCPVEKKAPYVCNACPKSRSCMFDKYLYNAEYAHKEYVNMLHSSREGIDLTKDELISLDELVTPLLKKGQSIPHIMMSHEEEIPCCSRTLYSYIDKGYLSIKNINMRRTVRYKKRIRKQPVKTSPHKKYGHLYKDFQKRLEEDPSQRVVEMDTVEGIKGGKVLQTLFWRQEKIMLAFLLDQKDQQSAA